MVNDKVLAIAETLIGRHMALLVVTRVVAKWYSHSETQVFELRFKNGIRLAVTAYHAFKVIRNQVGQVVAGDGVMKNDKVWVDVSAFSADNSLYVPTELTGSDWPVTRFLSLNDY